MFNSIYIHIPFCKKKCSYCDFFSIIYHPNTILPYVNAVNTELKKYARYYASPNFPRAHSIKTIYFGGGTPSILKSKYIHHILQNICELYHLPTDAEITVEANPETTSTTLCKELKSIHINRLSIGIQSFDDTMLRTLGRCHSSMTARDAMISARRASFNNINVDLIYGIPGQNMNIWRKTLEETVSLNPNHISTYELSLLPGTPLAQLIKKGTLSLPPPDTVANMYEMAYDYLGAAGYHHYEISNFSQPEFQCQHNMTYWQNQPYLGIGASAVSYLNRTRMQNVCNISKYIDLSLSGKDTIQWTESLDENTRMKETAVLALRTAAGLNLRKFGLMFGIQSAMFLERELQPFIKANLVKRTEGNISLTQKGFLVSNEIFLRII